MNSNYIFCLRISLVLVLNFGLKFDKLISCQESFILSLISKLFNIQFQDVMKEWIKTNPVNEKRMSEDPIMRKILQTPQKYKISFEEHPDADPVSRKLHLKRFQMNPLPNWGPKTKAPKLENSIEKEVWDMLKLTKY